MKNCLFFAIMAFAFMVQSCSGGSHKEQGEVQDKGSLANEPDFDVGSEKGEYFCEFQWTDDYKDWRYLYDKDEPKGTDKAKAPWCLIPYGQSTYYKFYFAAKAGENHYACRNKNEYFYQMPNEVILPEISIYIGENERIMRCVALKPEEPINVTASGGTQEYPDGTLDLPDFRNDKLYHVVEMNGVYIIEGHLNFKFVRLMKLNVLVEVFINNGGDIYYAVKNHETDINRKLKEYLSKAGYELNIAFRYIQFANRYNSYYDGVSRFLPGDEVIQDSILTISSPGFYDESRKINASFASNYDYIIGVTPINTNNKAGNKAVFDLNYANGLILTDKDFFNGTAEEKARLLASLLYSKIIGKNPISENGQNELWLSYYTKNLSFNQISTDWEKGRDNGKNQQGLWLEFARESIWKHRDEDKMAWR
jgi:hypothetical protein